MERDKGIEPSPRPWQGRVLPLYESRATTFVQFDIYNMAAKGSQGKRGRRASRCEPLAGGDESGVDFANASRFHKRRFFLTLREFFGAFAIHVDTRELFAVGVVDGHLPVTVSTSPVGLEARDVLGLFGWRFLHVASAGKALWQF